MACCQSTIADNRPHFWSNVGQLLFMYFILILDTCVPLSLLIENRDGWKFSNIVFGTCISLGYFCRLIKKKGFFLKESYVLYCFSYSKQNKERPEQYLVYLISILPGQITLLGQHHITHISQNMPQCRESMKVSLIPSPLPSSNH